MVTKLYSINTWIEKDLIYPNNTQNWKKTGRAWKEFFLVIFKFFFFLLENEATQRRECDDLSKNHGASHSIITSDTHDQFRLFYILERFLQSPPMLDRQMLLQISPDVQDMLIEK